MQYTSKFNGKEIDSILDNVEGKQDAIPDLETIRSNAKNASDTIARMVESGYLFAGVATIGTNPGTPDAKVFYIANGKGKYTNFGGLEVTEDEVVVLYWDSAWHKVATGIASQEKLSELRILIGEKADEADLATVAKTGKYADLVGKPTTLSGYGITDAYTKTKTDELLNAKQNELTLTVKDNGNIVIANIQGQSKEFMPATPSGDPMHYAYVAAGAEYNDTGADIVRTTPWADLADDDADKTVVHKAGYWYLNGLGDITNDEIRKIYQLTSDFPRSTGNDEVFSLFNIRTNFSNRRMGGNSSVTFYAGCYQSKLVVFNCELYAISSLGGAFTNCSNLAHIGQLSSVVKINYTSAFNGANQLTTIKLAHIASNIQIPSPKLSIKSVLYMINNEAATSSITITLHADVYNRCMANADILAALETHTNISLASA